MRFSWVKQTVGCQRWGSTELLSGAGSFGPNKGFTLLELLVVIAIIGLLASYVGPKLFGQVSKSQVQATRAQLDAFNKALDAYRLDLGRYPTTEQSLTALVAAPAQPTAQWHGPYLQKAIPLDPWGHPYLYRSPGTQGRDYDLWSNGRDGRPGGEGDDADIASWQ